ncbi:hypothetical protein OQA88_9361 [Cercophora sp. LCS_1]
MGTFSAVNTADNVSATSVSEPRQDVPQPPSAAFFAQLKPWIDECGSRHGPCPMLSADPHSLPTRVLKIISQEDGSLHVKLHEGNGEKVRYTTLSHCWGRYRPLVTTKANLSTHLQGIRWCDLLKTFQDAIAITHGFNVQYLWIDSLCIVQDDDEDWKRDPSPLASRAWILQERLLSPRVLYFCGDEVVMEVVMECSNHTRCQCSGIDASSPSPPDWLDNLGVDTHKEKTYETLRHRFMETVLSMYGCRMRQVTQLFSQSSQQPTSEWDLAPRLPFEVSNKSLELWDEILHHYCRRKITRLRDRVIGLTGIAGAFGSTGAYGHYYSGLWEVWFVHMLLWCVDVEGATDDLIPEPRPDEDPPLLPSWSWAKIRGSWLYRRPVITISQQILARRTLGELLFAVPERFGAVGKGVVTIEGWLVTAEVRYDALPGGLTYAERFRRQRITLVKEGEEEPAMMQKDCLG